MLFRRKRRIGHTARPTILKILSSPRPEEEILARAEYQPIIKKPLIFLKRTHVSYYEMFVRPDLGVEQKALVYALIDLAKEDLESAIEFELALARAASLAAYEFKKPFGVNLIENGVVSSEEAFRKFLKELTSFFPKMVVEFNINTDVETAKRCLSLAKEEFPAVEMAVDDWPRYRTCSLALLDFDIIKVDREYLRTREVPYERERSLQKEAKRGRISLESALDCFKQIYERELRELLKQKEKIIIAEGVETESKERRLFKMGFRAFQGYLYSKPRRILEK